MTRHKWSRPVFALLSLLMPTLIANAAESDTPDHERIHQSYELSHGASVEVLGIAGPVEIETTSSDTAEVNVVRTSPTHADLECGWVAIEQSPTRLRISSEQKCPIVRGQQSVALKLPRWVDLSLRNIAGHVHIGATDGMVRLESIAGHVTLTGLRAASMSSLAAGLTMSIAAVGERGIHISSVTGGINDVSDVRRFDDDGPDYRSVIGSGGGKIVIESVIGGVDIRRGR
jgi:hypothetical protein